MEGKPSLKEFSTFGNPNFLCSYKLSDGSLVNVDIMDTAGQERYKALNLSYYRKADCCLLVYDITNKKSFDEIKNYYSEKIKENCKQNIQVILLGNKTDLLEDREVLSEEGAKLALDNNYIFMETSCLKNENVASAFETLIEITNIETKKNENIKNSNIKDLNIENNNNNNKGGCC